MVGIFIAKFLCWPATNQAYRTNNQLNSPMSILWRCQLYSTRCVDLLSLCAFFALCEIELTKIGMDFSFEWLNSFSSIGRENQYVQQLIWLLINCDELRKSIWRFHKQTIVRPFISNELISCARKMIIFQIKIHSSVNENNNNNYVQILVSWQQLLDNTLECIPILRFFFSNFATFSSP